MSFTELLEERKVLLEKEIASLRRERKYPDGSLIIKYRGGRTSFYHTTKKDGKSIQKYLPKSNHELLSCMVKKRYQKIMLKADAVELSAIQEFQKAYQRRMCESDQRFVENSEVQSILSEQRRGNKAKSPAIREKVMRWSKESYKKSNKKEEHLTVPTGQGLWVRSKSEALIVSALRKYQIPFRYECALDVIYKDDFFTAYPDFTIMDPLTGKIYYWEHCGLMGDEGYEEDLQRKLQYYPENQIYPFQNLIMTYEDKEHPLSYEEIEATIRFWFVV